MRRCFRQNPPHRCADVVNVISNTHCSDFCSVDAKSALRDVCAYGWLARDKPPEQVLLLKQDDDEREEYEFFWLRDACAALISKQGKWIDQACGGQLSSGRPNGNTNSVIEEVKRTYGHQHPSESRNADAILEDSYRIAHGHVLGVAKDSASVPEILARSSWWMFHDFPKDCMNGFDLIVHADATSSFRRDEYVLRGHVFESEVGFIHQITRTSFTTEGAGILAWFEQIFQSVGCKVVQLKDDSYVPCAGRDVANPKRHSGMPLRIMYMATKYNSLDDAMSWYEKMGYTYALPSYQQDKQCLAMSLHDLFSLLKCVGQKPHSTAAEKAIAVIADLEKDPNTWSHMTIFELLKKHGKEKAHCQNVASVAGLFMNSWWRKDRFLQHCQHELVKHWIQSLQSFSQMNPLMEKVL